MSLVKHRYFPPLREGRKTPGGERGRDGGREAGCDGIKGGRKGKGVIFLNTPLGKFLARVLSFFSESSVALIMSRKGEDEGDKSDCPLINCGKY